MEAVKKVTGFALLEILFAVAVLVILGGGGALYTREMRQQKSIMQVGLGAEKKAQELKKQIEAQQKSFYKDVIAPNSPKSGKTICTMEAKLCPDGKTYVGRTGPRCEFAACPPSNPIHKPEPSPVVGKYCSGPSDPSCGPGYQCIQGCGP